jgi:hypothetical protein
MFAWSGSGSMGGPRPGEGPRRRRGSGGWLAATVVVLGAGWAGCATGPRDGIAASPAVSRAAHGAASLAITQVASLEPSQMFGEMPPPEQEAALPPPATPEPPPTPAPAIAAPILPDPLVEIPKRRIDSIAYARDRSGIRLFGEAWRWWSGSRGHYHRGQIPVVGAVLVLKRAGRSNGHLAVVTHRIGYREIVVDHANWLNQGHILRNSRVRDVSSANDWSEVRFWHAPNAEYGPAVYPASGFVYPLAAAELLDIRALRQAERSWLIGGETSVLGGPPAQSPP